MWCPVDILHYEQWSCDRVSVCVHVCTSESLKCDFVLLELLTLVASKNTTFTFSLCINVTNHFLNYIQNTLFT